MKRTDLEKSKASKLVGQMHNASIPGRFSTASGALPDRREQRKIDQAAGLVPFAVKLNEDLVSRLRDQAVQEGVSLNDLTDRLLKAGLAAAVPAKP
ncbi:MAG: hypothetical protein Q7U28_17000 [Aquabacterium sp.]|nr:hypothetical protein [Aquabacterium sp.]